MKLPLLVLLLFASAVFALGGDGVNNGGDAIECRDSRENVLAGTYSLDYLLTLPSVTVPDTGVVPVTSWEGSADRIFRLLQRFAPKSAASFADFRQTAFNTDDFTANRLWEPAAFGLIDLKDERIKQAIPENCKTGGKVMIVQTVLRLDPKFTGTNTIIYKYVPEFVNRLQAEDPQQLSFLMVHEWLWDVSGDVVHNRKVNRLLHSREIETMSLEEATRELKIE